MAASGLKSMSPWITVMILPPSQLAAYIPGEKIHYHTFTFCLDTCGTFCWVIYLCWILWVFHPNHCSRGLWIQKPVETKPLALLNFLACLIQLTTDTGYLRIWHFSWDHREDWKHNMRCVCLCVYATVCNTYEFERTRDYTQTWKCLVLPANRRHYYSNI